MTYLLAYLGIGVLLVLIGRFVVDKHSSPLTIWIAALLFWPMLLVIWMIMIWVRLEEIEL